MIKYMCDIKNCVKEATGFDGKDWADQEMVNMTLAGASYFWGRVGFANITLCPEHRKEAITVLIESLCEKYRITPTSK